MTDPASYPLRYLQVFPDVIPKSRYVTTAVRYPSILWMTDQAPYPLRYLQVCPDVIPKSRYVITALRYPKKTDPSGMTVLSG